MADSQHREWPFLLKLDRADTVPSPPLIPLYRWGWRAAGGEGRGQENQHRNGQHPAITPRKHERLVLGLSRSELRVWQMKQ